MAKGKKSPTPPKGLVPSVDAEALKKVSELKSAGNNLFASKSWDKAIEQYDAAMKLLPSGHVERSDLMCNKAACLYAQQKFKDAVKECGNALEVSPSSIKALRHRAKALEKQGLYKQALADIQSINKTESASDDSREAERRLKELMAGRRPSLANGGARAAAPSAGAGARGARSPLTWPFTAKVSHGAETRLVQLTANSGYADLLTAVMQKFPAAGPCVLKYVDREGDLVTITSRTDVQAAITEALQAADRRLGMAGIPPIKVQLSQVASKADMPPIPLDELQERQLQQQAALEAAAAAAASPAPKQQGTTPSGEVVEIDDFLIDFCNLFREVSGIDADKHIELHNEGWAAMTRAMEATLRSDEADPLFDKAAERFKEVAASGFINLGTVALYRAQKRLEAAALAGETSVSDDLAAQVAPTYDAAEVEFRRALEVKPDYADTLTSLATLEFDRAKLAAKLLVKPQPLAAEGEAQSEEAAQAATREALKFVQAADVAAAAPVMARARELYARALHAAAAADEARKAEAAARGDKGSGATEADVAPTTLAGHTQVMFGNSLYEWSQLLAAAGSEWRPVLDEAAALFREAGCAEADIRAALKNHSQAAHLDLGPDPEPERPTPAAEEPQPAASSSKPAPEAKGLPALGRKAKQVEK